MQNPRILKAWLGCVLFTLLVSTGPAALAKMRVVATTTLVADLVREVGGDRVEVAALMGAGVDPHLYKASAGDVARLGAAQIVFYSGLFLEGKMEEVFKKLKMRGVAVFAAAEAVPESDRLRPANFEGHPDPHVWGDPRLWKRAVQAVAEGLSAKDAEGSAVYRARAEAYGRKMDELFTWGVSRVSQIPQTQRVLITSHDAFNYFGRAFGFEVVGVQGISTVTEAGLADMTKVVDLVKARQLKAVFVESSVPPTTIRRISEDTGAKVGGELFSDALGTPGEMRSGGGERYDVGTYLGMLKHNINTVVESLR
ncbi:MAG: zinc ABC transporter substrate-binding protein [Verrucomicrobiales bacterium]|nr:zinc ABC transporter substrate-binding protein [Verrucomicrobiales bacterium]